MSALVDIPSFENESVPEAHRSVIEAIYSLAPRGSKFGIDRVLRFSQLLGSPHVHGRFAHVAGTNGKGSTSAFLSHILAERHPGVGLFTSPHLMTLRERIRSVDHVGAVPISFSSLAAGFLELSEVEGAREQLAFFEVMTLLALLHFRSASHSFSVVEAGLGARLDATRIVAAEVSVLTTISREHTQFLGDTLHQIAFEKTHVAREGRPLVARGGEGLDEAITQTAEELGASKIFFWEKDFFAKREGDVLNISLSDREVAAVDLGLPGEHQIENAALAAQAAVLVEPALTDDEIRAGLRRTRWPGRLERVSSQSRRYVLDGAHNVQGSKALGGWLQDRRREGEEFVLVFGCLESADVAGMCEALFGMVESVVVTEPRSRRRLPAQELFEAVEALHPVVETESSIVDSLSVARRSHSSATIVVCGSLYLVGDVRQILGLQP